MTSSSILTSSGRFLDLLDPDPRDIDLMDIALGLSRECRFSGQTKVFYSVAQHSVLVSRLVPEEYALEGLLHDATEGILRDIAAPIKKLLPDYMKIEGLLDRVIRQKFGLPEIPSSAVIRADQILLATEFRDVVNPSLSREAVIETLHFPAMEETISPLTSERALGLFLSEYRRILEKKNGSSEDIGVLSLSKGV